MTVLIYPTVIYVIIMVVWVVFAKRQFDELAARDLRRLNKLKPGLELYRVDSLGRITLIKLVEKVEKGRWRYLDPYLNLEGLWDESAINSWIFDGKYD